MARQSAIDRYIHLGNTGAILDEGQIMRGVRLTLHNLARRADRLSGTRYFEMTPDEAREKFAKLIFAFNENPPRPITEAHTRKGIDWFANMHKADGTWRDTEFTRCFNSYARACVDNFDHFLWAGFENIGTHYAFLVPEYHVVAKNGDSFGYHARSWQSGGGVEVF